MSWAEILGLAIFPGLSAKQTESGARSMNSFTLFSVFEQLRQVPV